MLFVDVILKARSSLTQADSAQSALHQPPPVAKALTGILSVWVWTLLFLASSKREENDKPISDAMPQVPIFHFISSWSESKS